MYQEIQPFYGKEYVDTYWIYQNFDSTSHAFQVFPDACVDIIFSLSEKKIFVVGTMTHSKQVSLDPGTILFGIRLRPGIALSLLKNSVSELVDKIIPLQDIAPKLFNEFSQFLYFPSVQHIFVAVEDFIKRGKIESQMNKKIFSSIQKMQFLLGERRICTLAKDLSISTRQLERYFFHAVGVTPKMFTRIIRFQKAHQLLLKNKGLLDISLSLGYYDQSHFHREYKEFSGGVPSNMSFFSNT